MTSLDNDISSTQIKNESEQTNLQPQVEVTNHSEESNSSVEQYYCQTCKKEYLEFNEYHDHLKSHIKQPKVVLQRIDDPEVQKKVQSHKCGPLKFTVRTTNNNFKIIPPTESNNAPIDESTLPRIPKLRILLPEQLTEQVFEEDKKKSLEIKLLENPEEKTQDKVEETICNGTINQKENMVELHSLPSESQSPSFPTQSPSQPDTANNNDSSNFWNTDQPVEDPLQVTQSGEKEAETHNNLLQNFLNDTVTVKESPIISNETEYISLERLAEKNSPQCPICGERCLDQKSLEVHQKAMGHYLSTSPKPLLSSPNNSLIPYGQPALSNSLSSNPLDSLANLPMQQLAQQVNRLQQSGVHQQNVLINIQQFGQPMNQNMPPPQYGRPPDLPHYPGAVHHYPPQQQPPPPPHHMYGGYHPSMNHPMYYPPTSGMFPPMSHNSGPTSMSHPFRPSGPPQSSPRMMPPRAPPPSQQHMAPPPPPPPAANNVRPRARMPMQRASAPRMMGPRGASVNNNNSGNMPRPNMPQHARPLRRAYHAAPPTDAKRKKLDVFLPDTNDNDECSVISVQKCNDGLPIIKNVQGASTSGDETDPIVHLTDSITLSVRNPPKEQPVVQQKKNDAKAVANILATRGITVTPAAKSNNNSSSSSSSSTTNSNGDTVKRNPQKPASPPVAINLNSAVSIIPTARGNNPNAQQKESTNNRPSRPPTVDLTDDEPSGQQSSQKSTPAAAVIKRTLPHHCDLCPAQYPTLQSLMQHRRSYHKIVGQNELGVPVIDLKQAAVLQKLANIGIHSYIPLPQLGNGNGNFALPVVSVNAAKNPNICNLGALGSGAVLPLGPLRHFSNSPNGKQ